MISSELKQERLEIALTELSERGIPYHSNNGNIHIQIKSPSKWDRADLWPTTNRWSVIIDGRKQTGTKLSTLLEIIRDWGCDGA